VKRIRQIIVAALGLFYVGLLYPLYTDLWHSKWLIEMRNEECEPMFLTFFVTARSVSIVGCAKAHAVQARDCFRSVAQPRTFGNHADPDRRGVQARDSTGLQRCDPLRNDWNSCATHGSIERRGSGYRVIPVPGVSLRSCGTCSAWLTSL